MSQSHDARLSCTQRAYLWFERDGVHCSGQLDQAAFDPDRVTELVGLSPTSSWRRGEVQPSPVFPRVRRFSSWKYELPTEQTYLSEDVVTSLLDVIEPYADGITNACRTLQLVAGINLVIEMEGYHDGEGGVIVSTAAPGFSRSTIQRLARLNLSVDHDQYVNIS